MKVVDGGGVGVCAAAAEFSDGTQFAVLLAPSQNNMCLCVGVLAFAAVIAAVAVVVGIIDAVAVAAVVVSIVFVVMCGFAASLAVVAI